MKRLLFTAIILLGLLGIAQAQLLTYGPVPSNTISVANNGTTGTTINTLTKLTGAPSTAIITAITDTKGAIGITIGGAGTTGNAAIQTSGFVNCVFDGATTGSDFVIISSTTAGNCHDAGSAYPTTGEVLGRVLSTNASGGTYQMLFFSPDTAGGGGGSQGIVTHSLSGTAPTLLVNSSTVPTIDYNNITLSGNTTTTVPASTAVSNDEIIVYNIVQVAANYTQALSAVGTGTTLVYKVPGGSCPAMPTGANSSETFIMHYNTGLTEWDVVGCVTNPAQTQYVQLLSWDGTIGAYTSSAVKPYVAPCAGHFTQLVCTATLTGSCTTGPTINVKDITGSTTGTAVSPTTTVATLASSSETLTFSSGDTIGFAQTATTSSCTAPNYSCSATVTCP